MTPLEELQQTVLSLTVPLTVTVTQCPGYHAGSVAAYELIHLLVADNASITLRTRSDDTAPVVTIHGPAGECPVSFWGAPSGYELEGLVKALRYQQSSPLTTLGKPTIELLRQIDAPLTSDLYVAPT